jgi:phage gpG-like protein
MAVRLSGDFDRLERLITRAGRIQSPQFRRNLLDEMAAEVNRQIGLGFRLSQDPFGRPWKPLTSRVGRPLVKTGKLQRAAQSAKPTATGVMVVIDLIQAATHQYGARIRAKNVKALRFRIGQRVVFAKSVTIPARPFLPEGEIPPRWRDGLAHVVTVALSRTLRGV